MTTIISTFNCHSIGDTLTPNGSPATTAMASSVAPSMASRPPTIRMEVEAKNATPLASEPCIIVSTMRITPRSAMLRIHIWRRSLISALALRLAQRVWSAIHT